MLAKPLRYRYSILLRFFVGLFHISYYSTYVAQYENWVWRGLDRNRSQVPPVVGCPVAGEAFPD